MYNLFGKKLINENKHSVDARNLHLIGINNNFYILMINKFIKKH